jgi:hypothetical protein
MVTLAIASVGDITKKDSVEINTEIIKMHNLV